ncbi:hypothetical protein ACTUVN_002370 [Pseudomonas caspiana]
MTGLLESMDILARPRRHGDLSATYAEFESEIVRQHLKEMAKTDSELYIQAIKYLSLDFGKLAVEIYRACKTEIGIAPDRDIEEMFMGRISVMLGNMYLADRSLTDLEQYAVNSLESDLGL